MLGVFSARRHRTLEKAGQIHNKKTHGRCPWQAGRSTQTQMGARGTVTAGGPCPGQRGTARADGTDAAKRQDGI